MKKIIIFIISFFSILSSKSQSPNFQWANQFTGTSDNYGYSVVTDASGNVYTTGTFAGTCDFDPSNGTSFLTAIGYDVFVTKFDASGNFVWAKSLGGSLTDVGVSIAVDASGNVFTIGDFEDVVDFDPGVGTYTLNSNGAYDIFISKLDPLGNFLWAKQFGGTSFDEGKSISLDASGNVYTTGYFSTIVDFDPGSGTFNLAPSNDDVFISKLDAAGNFVYAKKLGGILSEVGFSIFVNNSGEVYTTGGFAGTVDFDPGPTNFSLISAGSQDVFVSKLDATGIFLWAKQMGGNNTEFGYSITEDNSGNVLITGIFDGTSDFDPGVAISNLTSAGMQDVFISKLDGLGNFIWAKNIGSTSLDYGECIKTDILGNIFVTGYFEGTVDFNPGVGVNNLSSLGLKDIFIVKLDASGNYVWAKNIGGSSDDKAYSIFVNSSSNVYLTGYFYGIVDFDTGVNTFNLNSGNSQNTFVLKMSTTTNGLKENIMSNNFNIYPNPINDILNMELNSEDLLKYSQVEISNSLGQIILNEKIENSKVDLRKLNSGIYFLKVISDDKIVGTQKIIKE